MSNWIMAHPYLTCIVVIFALLAVDNMVRNISAAIASRGKAHKDEEVQQ